MFYAENPEWEDEETLDDTAPSPDELGELPPLRTSSTRPLSASIPIYDNCRMLRIVHTNGVHELSVTFCRCPNAQREDIQLLKLGYFPASRLRPSTAFTFECLDDFLLSNKSMKSSPLSYHTKLCRATDGAFHHSVPVSSPNIIVCVPKLSKYSTRWHIKHFCVYQGSGAT